MIKPVSFLLFSSFVLLPSSFAQGPLTPAGVPAPIFKTLEQIEPRTAITNVPITISARGSYYLDRNLTMTGGTTGITIITNDVTVDLNSFVLASAGSSGDGIFVQNARSNIVVKGGTVRNWGANGLQLGAGHRSQVSDVQAIANGQNGILAGQGVIVSHCRATKNTGSGVDTGSGCIVNQCEAYDNNVVGFDIGSRSSVANCVALRNDSNGFRLAEGVLVSDCVASENQGHGIAVALILGTEGVSILDCSSTSNRLDGILVGAQCLVRGNNCVGNGPAIPFVGAGIHVAGSQNRIEDNHCTGNDTGLDVGGVSNLVIRNSASGNGTEYSIAAGNSAGGIVDVAGVGFTNTNPWANFEF